MDFNKYAHSFTYHLLTIFFNDHRMQKNFADVYYERILVSGVTQGQYRTNIASHFVIILLTLSETLPNS